MWPAGPGKRLSPCTWHYWGHTLNTGFNSVPLTPRRALRCWHMSRERQRCWWRFFRTGLVRSSWGNWGSLSSWSFWILLKPRVWFLHLVADLVLPGAGEPAHWCLHLARKLGHQERLSLSAELTAATFCFLKLWHSNHVSANATLADWAVLS